MCTKRSAARGFTLIELIVFIVIVLLALAAMVDVIRRVVSVSADPLQPKQAMLVAESMLEEILLKPYSSPLLGYVASCPGTCDRTKFDNVGDYSGYTSNGVYSLDDMATPVAGLERYTVSVSVNPATLSATANGVACQRVEVKVTASGTTYTLSGYRFDYD